MEIVLVGQMDMMMVVLRAYKKVVLMDVLMEKTMVVMMVSLLDNTMVVHLVYALVVNWDSLLVMKMVD